MTFRQRKKEMLQSTEQKLTKLLAELNADSREEAGPPVCETECTMARIRAYSDFLYLLRVKPFQTFCYYAAAFFFLIMLSAVWCSEWVLAVIFGVIFLIFATLPHNMRIHYFNKQADSLEDYYNKVINAEFAEEEINLTISRAVPQKQQVDADGNSVARVSAAADDAEAARRSLPYSRITQAVECAHSFYLFPVDENGKPAETIICDKTQFLRGTPMQLRDLLARKCGRHFKIKVKKTPNSS